MKLSDVRVMGRATQGVRLINLEKRSDEIASVCKVMTEVEDEELPENELSENHEGENTENTKTTVEETPTE